MAGIFVIALVVSLQMQDTVQEARAQEIDELVQQLESDKWQDRSRAIRGLAYLKSYESASLIAQQIDDEVAQVRLAAMRALSFLKAKEQAPKIAQLLSDEESRVPAVDSLLSLEAREFAPSIAKLLEDKNKRVRDVAAIALAELDARDQITKRLGHQDPGVRKSAAKALKLLDEKKK